MRRIRAATVIALAGALAVATLVAVPQAFGAGTPGGAVPHASAASFPVPILTIPYEVAFPDTTGALSGFGNLYGSTSFGVKVASGTSASGIGVGGFGFDVAVQGGNGHLWVASTASAGAQAQDLGVAMAAGTSPAAALTADGSADFAWHGNNGDLWKTSPAGPTDLGVA